jgi:phosphoserine phosphatase
MNWKKRVNQNSYIEYEKALVSAYDAALLHISVQDFNDAAAAAFDEYKDQTYTYTKNLLQVLKDQDYLLFAISASQADIVKLLADYYRFDDWGGSFYQTKDGQFTGFKRVLRREKKPLYLKQLVEKHSASYSGSIGVGDSDSDILMLQTVETPIAFNPNRKLFNHAQLNSWKVVIERKNMLYELEASNGIYVLA